MALRRVWAFTCLALLTGAPAALAEPLTTSRPSPLLLAQNPGRGAGLDGEALLETLNLSDGQRQQLQSIRQQYQPRISERSRSLREARQELRRLLTGSASESAIRDQRARVERLEREVEDLRFQSLLEMREVLTPEQRRRFGEYVDQRRENFQQRREDFSPRNRR